MHTCPCKERHTLYLFVILCVLYTCLHRADIHMCASMCVGVYYVTVASFIYIHTSSKVCFINTSTFEYTVYTTSYRSVDSIPYSVIECDIYNMTDGTKRYLVLSLLYSLVQRSYKLHPPDIRPRRHSWYHLMKCMKTYT